MPKVFRKIRKDLLNMGKIKSYVSQDIDVGNLYQVNSFDTNFLNSQTQKQIKKEMTNLLSEYYFATEIANKAYPGMVKDARNLIAKCKKYINK